MPETIPKLFTLAEVATALGISTHTVRVWVRRDKLRPIRICRRLLFAAVDVEQFVRNAQSEARAVTAIENIGQKTDPTH